MTNAIPPQSSKNKWQTNGYFWLAVIIPALTVVLCAFFIVLAIQNKDSLVRDNWYMDGKALEQDLSKDSYASLFKISAQLSIIHPTAPSAQPLSFSVQLGSQRPITWPKKITLHFYHATQQQRDFSIDLTHQAKGRYAATTQHVFLHHAGKYNIEIETSQFRLRQSAHWPITQVALTPLPLALTTSQPE